MTKAVVFGTGANSRLEQSLEKIGREMLRDESFQELCFKVIVVNGQNDQSMVIQTLLWQR